MATKVAACGGVALGGGMGEGVLVNLAVVEGELRLKAPAVLVEAAAAAAAAAAAEAEEEEAEAKEEAAEAAAEEEGATKRAWLRHRWTSGRRLRT